MSSDSDFRLQKILEHAKAIVALAENNQQSGVPSSSLKRGKVKPCNKCGSLIYLQQEGDKWFPYNANDNTKHRC